MAISLKKGEVGLRFSVPAEMTDVYERLRASAPKRRSFEALHLMRLGLAFERLSQGGALTTQPVFWRQQVWPLRLLVLPYRSVSQKRLGIH